jgi:predicted ATP-dependent endonuclease of OLD family
MKIKKIKAENYRLLKLFSIDLEENLSLVIGKNNTGKTSLLSLLDKFLNGSDNIQFTFDDFNIEFKKKIKTIIESPIIGEEEYEPFGIKLKLFIEYDEKDSLANISKVMMDLDPDNNFVVLSFEYLLDYSSLERLKEHFIKFKENEIRKSGVKKSENQENVEVIEDKDAISYVQKDTYYFLKKYQSEYFSSFKKSIEYNIETGEENDSVFIDLVQEKISIKDIINFKYIPAKREVTNKESNKTLSVQTSKIYNKTEKTAKQNEIVEEFQEKLIETDSVLSDIYKTLFKTVVEKVKKFGGIKVDDSSILVESTLQDKELLEGNTTVMYQHYDTTLPEHHNGLGYMNLISMIFEIEILVQEFKKKKDEKPSDINLLFVEEPEAHTHPQMQYVFIKNIKNLLKEGIVREDGNNRKLQTIITTHSSHIVSESDFKDIKYLKKEDDNSVISKNLTELENLYSENPKQYEFLKQYLTLSRSEIFFADKAILIEGDTERILIPTLMKKIDKEEERRFKALGTIDENSPLTSQNISVIEVGAYSQIFELFIDFIDIKTLIITDLDAVDGDGKKCRVTEGVSYSNDALTYFFNDCSLDDLKGYSIENKKFSKIDNNWINDVSGSLCIVYQTIENEVNARSFEDAFIEINKVLITENRNDFKGLKNRAYFLDDEKDSYTLADDCIKKKTHFALDILFHTDSEFTNWEIPSYIKEGLLWLK